MIRADNPAVPRFSRRLRGTISPGAVNALASAIQSQEGYYPGSLAYRNNNPGNLRFVGQAGAVPGEGGFARFPSYDAGLNALRAQINLDATRGTDAAGRPVNTVSDLIGSWAPASDPRNNTPAYIASVASRTGFDADAPLSSLGDGAVNFDENKQSAGSSENFDLSAVIAPTVDLSAVGLSSSVPVWWLAGGLVALLLLRR